MYEHKLEFPGGSEGGVQNKKMFPWGEYGYFLELHIVHSIKFYFINWPIQLAKYNMF